MMTILPYMIRHVDPRGLDAEAKFMMNVIQIGLGVVAS